MRLKMSSVKYQPFCIGLNVLTHPVVASINDAFIGLNYGLSPDQHQTIILTNNGLLFIGPMETNFNEIQINVLPFAYKKMLLRIQNGGLYVLDSVCPCCLGLLLYHLHI